MNIFCIVGKSGSGKSFYFDQIIKDSDFIHSTNLKPLVYGTTREPRENECDGVDYFFFTDEKFDKIPKENIIECRTYKLANGKCVKYFTKENYFVGKENIICAVSPYQFDSYVKWANKKNEEGQDVHIYLIYIDADIKTRVERSLSRCTTEDDVLETCRRTLEEGKEFLTASKDVFFMVLSSESNEYHDCSVECIKIDNTSKDDTTENIRLLKNFITDRIWK